MLWLCLIIILLPFISRYFEKKVMEKKEMKKEMEDFFKDIE